MLTVFKIIGENKTVFEDEHINKCLRCSEKASPEKIQEAKNNLKYHFRCIDDDGISYFWGICNDKNSFFPLDTIGAEYGCTEIQYKNEKGIYETL